MTMSVRPLNLVLGLRVKQGQTLMVYTALTNMHGQALLHLHLLFELLNT